VCDLVTGITQDGNKYRDDAKLLSRPGLTLLTDDMMVIGHFDFIVLPSWAYYRTRTKREIQAQHLQSLGC
jgi:hypothetical protein